VSAFAEDVSRETRLESVDHDRTLRNAMAACPELLPSYRRLASHLQDRVRRVIGANFNLMQFAQGESLPASLLSLRRLARDRDGPRLCRFALLLWILRVPAFWRVPGLLKNMRGAIEALLRLEDGTVGAARVYDEFLSIRASLLNFAFDAQNRSERHLVRLALMLRLSTPGEAVVLKGAFGLLDLDVQAVLMGELNATGVDDGWGTVWKSTSASGAPDNSSLSHSSAMRRPSWLGRAVMNGIATPSSWRRVDGVEVGATIHERAVKFDFHTGGGSSSTMRRTCCGTCGRWRARTRGRASSPGSRYWRGSTSRRGRR